MESNLIELYIYDLSDGWCGNLGLLSPVKAIWHTSIVAFGKEYVFGTNGIKFHNPGTPLKKIELGEIDLTPTEFKIYVKSLKYSDFNASSYDPLEHNCNHFTDHLARYLGFGSIPEYIFESTDKLRESPFYSKVVDMITKNEMFTLAKLPTATPVVCLPGFPSFRIKIYNTCLVIERWFSRTMGRQEVKLYIYDMAPQISHNMGIAFPKQRIWHSSIVVFGKEYSYGLKGINITEPHEDAIYDIISLGFTTETEEELKTYVRMLKSDWDSTSYHLWHHNCHQFVELLINFLELDVSDVPSYLSTLPEKLGELSPKHSVQSKVLNTCADFFVDVFGSGSSGASQYY